MTIDGDINEKELELCTFAPVTIDCPSYVKRIAMSMAAVKAAAVGQNKGTFCTG